MYFYHHLKIFIDNPAQHAETIKEIIEAAKNAESTISGLIKVLENPFNSELRLFNPGSFIKTQINFMWSAATLMLAIPEYKTKENIELSLSYLKNSAEKHGLSIAYNSLGWCYSQGIKNHLAQDIPTALKFFTKFHETSPSNHNWNSLAWCHEQLGNYSLAKSYWNKTMEYFPDNERALRHNKECKKIIKQRTQDITAFRKFSLFLNNKRNLTDAKESNENKRVKLSRSYSK